MIRPPTGKRFLVVCLNPVIQKTLVYSNLRKGEVNRTANYRLDAAGKGVCAARVLSQLGEQVEHLTHLGERHRPWFLELCQDDHLDIRWVDSGSPIRFCTTLIDEADQTATELVEEAQPVTAPTRQRLLKLYREILPIIDVVMLSGTVAAGYGPGLMGDLARQATAAGKRLYLDLKGQDLLDCLSAHPVCVKPNLEELAITVQPNRPLPADDSAARKLVSKVGAEWFKAYGCYLIVTRGSQTCLFWDGQALNESPAEELKVVNPIGSGDAFGVGLATSLEHGDDIASAVARAVKLGGLNATKLKPGSIS